MYYLTFALTLPLLLILVNQFIFRNKFSYRVLIVANFLVIWGYYAGSAKYYDNLYKAEMKAYDLDSNGGFSKEEMTLEARKAMDHVVNDTGRVFAPLVGILHGIFFSVLFMFEIFLFRKLMRHEKST